MIKNETPKPSYALSETGFGKDIDVPTRKDTPLRVLKHVEEPSRGEYVATSNNDLIELWSRAQTELAGLILQEKNRPYDTEISGQRIQMEIIVAGCEAEMGRR